MAGSSSAAASVWKESDNCRDHFNISKPPGSNNQHFQCKWCGDEFDGSATRAFAHLTGQSTGKSRCGVRQCPAVSEPARRRIMSAKAAKDAEESNRKRRSDTTVQQLERAAAAERLVVVTQGTREQVMGSVSS
jgi:hypothetical protein